MPSFQVRNPLQQFAGSLANACDAVERRLTAIVWVLGGACYGGFLLLVIDYFRGPMP